MSGKRRRAEIKAARARRRERAARDLAAGPAPEAHGQVRVNPERLAPDSSYGAPDFVERGYYVDLPFACIDCGREEVWRATQQKGWYEVALGGVWTTARRCRACRRRERERREEARRVHLDGVVRKQGR